MNETSEIYTIKICYIAALLFLLSNVCGLVLLFIIGDLISANRSQMFNAHLNGLIGTFWLLGIAFTYKWLQLGAVSKKLLFYSSVTASFALVVLSIIKSIANIASTSDSIIVSLAYMLTVVIPTFISAALWIIGLRKNLK